jgi:tRNA pseudouridine32 synthase / 23S rRNA pseudouridine746 synthase
MDQVTYWYEGISPQGEILRLPRTVEVEAIARDLMAELATDERYAQEGKMYGVLLVKNRVGDRQILKAFSGLLNGESMVSGWVPPIPGREQVALAEAETLQSLAELKQQLIDLHNIPARQQYAELRQSFVNQLEEMSAQHQQRKAERQKLRGSANSEELDRQSQQDGIERRNLKRLRDSALQPLREAIEQADHQIQELKQQRKVRSQSLQRQMHESYRLINFLGTSSTLQALMPQGMPTGTGDCCAPKLLHYAATHHLTPIALAEFWWGSTTADKVAGEFYGACLERCQPLMGFMLAGLPTSLSVLYEDEWLIAVDKPAGLLSVPGRYSDRQDSILTRLRLKLQDPTVLPVHRLDQDTSGILLFAKDLATYHALAQQFQQRQVHKIYEAVLTKKIPSTQGIIDLPLWSDPQDRPKQKVDWQRGKPSLTKFRVLDSGQLPGQHIEFMPITGRTHQIRVHAAVGLGTPILGDRLYGCPSSATRLHLHARELHLQHPHTQQLLKLTAPAPQYPPTPIDDPS